MSENNRHKRVASQMAERYGVDPEIFKQSMEKEAPSFQDTWKVTSLLRFLKASGDRIMEKANGYLV